MLGWGGDLITVTCDITWCELLQEASVDQAIQEHIEQLEMMETNHKKQVS